uniref:Uncharacterized protein n=1 Tax=Anopheles farauti TaxID=69004 RepID=A0A182QX90_9DIPT
MYTWDDYLRSLPDDNVAVRHAVVDRALAIQYRQSRVLPERFLHAQIQILHLFDVFVRDLAVVAFERVVNFGLQLGHHARAVGELVQRERDRSGRCFRTGDVEEKHVRGALFDRERLLAGFGRLPAQIDQQLHEVLPRGLILLAILDLLISSGASDVSPVSFSSPGQRNTPAVRKLSTKLPLRTANVSVFTNGSSELWMQSASKPKNTDAITSSTKRDAMSRMSTTRLPSASVCMCSSSLFPTSISVGIMLRSWPDVKVGVSFARKFFHRWPGRAKRLAENGSRCSSQYTPRSWKLW